ncbi:WD repeat-containing protein 63 [Phlyctochytrium planicorne]|nr:WD repeat-containing protein 63 [Phlyctochytrium planicorne]
MSTPSRDKTTSKSSLRSKADLIETPQNTGIGNVDDISNAKLKSRTSLAASKPGTTQSQTSGTGDKLVASVGSTDKLLPSSGSTIVVSGESGAQTSAKQIYGSDAFAPPNPNVEIPTEGILPLFLTSMTQELFHVKSNDEVTAEKPIKIIPKADFLSDIQARLAISDFQPAKAYIQEYPGEELLLYFDSTFKYGQNFFLCISPDAAAQILQMYLKISQKLKDFGTSYKFTDKEASESTLELRSFKDANFEVNRMELPIALQAVPQVKEIGVQTSWFRPQNFSTQYEPRTFAPEVQQQILRLDEMVDFVTSVTERFEKVLQQNCIMDIFSDDYLVLGEEDVALEQGSHTSLQEYQSFTDLKHSKDKSIACIDWHPVQKGVVAISCVQRCTFDERVEAGYAFRSKESLLLIWSFHDPIHPQLILEAPDDVLCFQFNPTDSNIIAGGCVNGQILIWDISEYQDKLKSNKKPKSSESSRAGKNGTSTAEGGGRGDRNSDAAIPSVKIVSCSSIEFSHRMPVTDIQWLPRNLEMSHSGEIIENGDNGSRQLVTCSSDGQACFWDTRSKKDLKSLDLIWKPFLRVPLSAMDNTFDYGLAKISIKPPLIEKLMSDLNLNEKADKNAQKFSTKFFSATEEGDLIYSDWMQEKANEEKASRVECALSCHFGPISDLQRSPFFPDILLSVGGWSFHIWKEKVTSGPLLSSGPSSSYVISGRWSPTRPGVFFISKANGQIEVWDLLDRSHLPSTVQNVSSIAVSNIAIHQYPGKSGFQFIAAGDDEGTLHILEVPRNLSKPNKNEQSFVRAFFEREVRRIGYVFDRKQFRNRERGKWEQAALEAAAAQKGAQPSATNTKPEDATAGGAAATGAPPPPGNATSGQDEMEKLEQEYLKMERTGQVQVSPM